MSSFTYLCEFVNNGLIKMTPTFTTTNIPFEEISYCRPRWFRRHLIGGKDLRGEEHKDMIKRSKLFQDMDILIDIVDGEFIFANGTKRTLFYYILDEDEFKAITTHSASMKYKRLLK